ncbi:MULTISPECIES: hypothetical protein [unclassified Bradyrhizobium]|uniref:hypothetical protein n=1 Tax=unclassified Bradyrhizobium TaxID=2631580 RepID=UPI0012F93ACC|nr:MULTISPECIES: hypothetical protein [unclassified Bradyrhizobium]MBB4392840.1 hypothetical protein [Bradyrhizobium sp. ERR14]
MSGKDRKCYKGKGRARSERGLFLQMDERESDAEELASFGIAYLHRLPKDEC